MYHSKSYTISHGPAVSIKIALTQHGLSHIDLMSNKKGLSYSFEGVEAFPRLEEKVQEWLEAYCNKKQPKIFVPFLIDQMPPYSGIVLEELSKIPFGTVLSYQELAMQSGNPKAARAVGSACARNPLPLFIPCHRVLTSTYSLGGFSCGLDIKKTLLSFEGVSKFTKN